MALVMVDALPDGQAVINTDHVIVARTINGRTTIYLLDGFTVDVPHESAARLYEEISEAMGTD